MLILKELIRKYDPKVISLPETRISGQRADEICWRIGFEGIHKVDAQGFSLGIWILWKPKSITLKVTETDSQFFTLEICEHDNNKWLFTSVYACPHEPQRGKLCNKLRAFSSNTNIPSILVSDFNEMRSMVGTRNCSNDLPHRCDSFNHWLKIMSLLT